MREPYTLNPMPSFFKSMAVCKSHSDEREQPSPERECQGKCRSHKSCQGARARAPVIKSSHALVSEWRLKSGTQ